MPMPAIEDTIKQVEQFYRTVTGHEPPEQPESPSPIPPEADPEKYVESQLGRLLQALGQPELAVSPQTWLPPLSVWEGVKDFVFCLDLPGVAREAVTVGVAQNLLTVAGHRPAQLTNGVAGSSLRFTERPFGPFRRSIPLPLGVDAAEMSARMKDGVLEIRVPRPSSKTAGASQPQTLHVK